MVNYRRLISYIYAYEGSAKGKNIGFAKLETRSGQCRLNVNVKKVYSGGSDLGVYLLAPDKEIFLGNIFIHNGAGEFRAVIPMVNIGGSGCAMEICYGLSVHEKEEDWRVYKTIWEDAVTQAAEVDLAEVTSQNVGDESEQIHRKLTELNQEIQAEEERLEAERAKLVLEEKEREAAREETKEPEEDEIQIEKAEMALKDEKEGSEAPHSEEDVEAGGQDHPEDNQRMGSGTQMLLQNLNKVGNILGILPAGHEKPVEEKEQAREEAAQEPSEPLASHPARVSLPQEEEFPLENPEKLARLEQEESAGSPELLWEAFRKRYPKIQAFDSPGTIEILTIRPQDIGLLPRENWTYGNNSFLLHGYYNYRYLVFARVGDEARKRVRYILGVPGHYYSSEKYMASMFGFPHFVLAKKQPVQNGRFGYWYADVSMENTD